MKKIAKIHSKIIFKENFSLKNADYSQNIYENHLELGNLYI